MDIVYYLHLIPLTLGISFIYAGTRCEDVKSIIRQGFRISLSIFMFLLVSLAIFWACFGC